MAPMDTDSSSSGHLRSILRALKHLPLPCISCSVVGAYVPSRTSQVDPTALGHEVPSKSIASTRPQSSPVRSRGCGSTAKQAKQPLASAAAAVASTGGAGTGPCDGGDKQRPSQASCKREKRGRYGPGSIIGQSPCLHVSIKMLWLVSIFASSHLAAN